MELDDSGNQLQQKRQKQEQQQQGGRQQPLSWLGNVRVVDVQTEGPGSRAYNPAAEQQLQAVAVTRDFAAYEPVGLYLVRTWIDICWGAWHTHCHSEGVLPWQHGTHLWYPE